MIIEELIKAATCQVRSGSETGTGWLVAPNLVITAGHCVEASPDGGESPRIMVEFGLGASATSHMATVAAVSADHDVACLRLAEHLPLEPVPLSPETARAGQRWFSFGRPTSKLDIGHRLEGTISQMFTGRPSGIDIELAVDGDTQLSDYEGFSGGAVLTDSGCVGILISVADGALGSIGSQRIESLLIELGVRSAKDTDHEPQVHLIARDEFQQEFEQKILAENGGFWFLEGAPGIGKSTFLGEFVPRSSQLEVLGRYSFSTNSEGRTPAYWSQPDVFEDWLGVTYANAASGAPARLAQKSSSAMIQAIHATMVAFAQRCTSQGKVGLLVVDAVNEAERGGADEVHKLLRMFPMTVGSGLAVVFSSTNFESVAATLGSRWAVGRRMTLPNFSRERSAEFCAQELS